MGLLYVLYVSCLVLKVHAQIDPTNIVCTALNSTGLGLTWTQASDPSIVGYYLNVVRVDGLRIEPAIPTKDLNSPIYDTHDTYGLGKYGTYNITLFSYTSSVNNTPYVTTCTTLEDEPDSSPYNFACTAYSISALQCSWDDLAQVYWNGIAQGYRLQWMKSANISELHATTVDSNTTSKLLSGLAYGTMFTLLLNPYNNVGHSTVYATTMAATKGFAQAAPEENVTRYYCNEAVPGMIEFDWEEMPCTIYSGTIGALIIVCTLFISIFACQACCQSKPGGGTNLSLNMFSQGGRGGGRRRFQDDDSETDDDDDDDDYPPIKEKHPPPVDNDLYNHSEEEEDNKGYSSEGDHEYDDRYTATPGEDRNTVTPGSDRQSATPGSDRNTTTPGDGTKTSMSTTASQNEDTNTNRARAKKPHRKRIITARDVELNDINEENSGHSDGFSDSDYDSQYESDNEAGPLDKPGMSAMAVPVVAMGQSETQTKELNKDNNKGSVPKSETIGAAKGETAKRNKQKHKLTKEKTKTKADVHGMKAKGNGDIGGEKVNQKNTSDNINMKNEPLKNESRMNGREHSLLGDDDDDEWGSPACDTSAKQTPNPTNNPNKLMETSTATANNSSWDNNDDWGDTTDTKSEVTNVPTSTHKLTKHNNKGPGLKTMEVIEDNESSGWDTPVMTNQMKQHKDKNVSKSKSLETNKHLPPPVVYPQNIAEQSGWDSPVAVNQMIVYNGTKHMPPSVVYPQHVAEQSGWESPTAVANTMMVHNNATTKHPARDDPISHSESDSGWDTPGANNNPAITNKTFPGTDEWGLTTDTKMVIPTNQSLFGKQKAVPLIHANNDKHTGQRASKSIDTVKTNPDGLTKHVSASNGEAETWPDNPSNPTTYAIQPNEHHIRNGNTKSSDNENNKSKANHGHSSSVNFMSSKPFADEQKRNSPEITRNGNQNMRVGKGSDNNKYRGNRSLQQNVKPGQKNNGKISFRDQQTRPPTSSMEYKNMFYMEDELDHEPGNSMVNNKAMSDPKHTKPKQNGKMIRTNAWQPQNKKESVPVKSGRKTPVKSIPKSQSWTTLEPEPVIGMDRLAKKFPFLSVNSGAKDTSPDKMRKVASETDVQNYDTTLSEIRRSSEPVKSDGKMKDAVNAFAEPSNKSKKTSLVYGFGVHGRFREMAVAFVARFRAKKNPVKTVNSEWF